MGCGKLEQFDLPFMILGVAHYFGGLWEADGYLCKDVTPWQVEDALETLRQLETATYRSNSEVVGDR